MKYHYDSDYRCIVCESNNVEECLEEIVNLGFDCDGCSTAENLKSLVSELVEIASSGLAFLNEGKIYSKDTEEEDAESLSKAEQEQANVE